jgi:hypothetical protein
MRLALKAGLTTRLYTKVALMKTHVKSIGLAMLVLTAVMSVACGASTINKVLADPQRYRNREVKLTGSVVDSFSLVGRGAYQLEDKTGKLWIVSDRGVPRRGARVDVKGTVREGFNLGSLGDRIKVPNGLVIIENSHKAK